MDVRIITDGARLEEMLHGPAGLVYTWLDKESWLYKVATQDDAPVMTGCLRDTILRRPIEEYPGGLSVRVVSDTAPCSPTHTSYSEFVHNGAPPHDIPNAFGYGPTFGIGGRFMGKFHPGNAPNPYLLRHLDRFAK